MNYFKPPFRVGEYLDAWCVLNGDAGMVGIYGTREAAEIHKKRFAKKYPVKRKPKTNRRGQK